MSGHGNYDIEAFIFTFECGVANNRCDVNLCGSWNVRLKPTKVQTRHFFPISTSPHNVTYVAYCWQFQISGVFLLLITFLSLFNAFKAFLYEMYHINWFEIEENQHFSACSKLLWINRSRNEFVFVLICSAVLSYIFRAVSTCTCGSAVFCWLENKILGDLTLRNIQRKDDGALDLAGKMVSVRFVYQQL